MAFFIFYTSSKSGRSLCPILYDITLKLNQIFQILETVKKPTDMLRRLVGKHCVTDIFTRTVRRQMEGKGDQWRDGQINLRNSVGVRREMMNNH